MSLTLQVPSYALDDAERDRFRTDGYLGPLTLCSPEQMADIRAEIETVLETPAPDHRHLVHNRHLDRRVVYDLATHPAILDRIASLYGPDLLLWRTNFFVKHQGSTEIPWHQDFNYWPLEPPVIGSAWIAIDEATVENACMQVIPGSHRKVVPHVTSTDGMEFGEMAHGEFYDVSRKVNLEMKPGQFVLFNERTLHHSESNRSPKRRIGLAVRLVIPIVNVLSYDSPNHGLQLVRGRDPMGFNRLVEPPSR